MRSEKVSSFSSKLPILVVFFFVNGLQNGFETENGFEVLSRCWLKVKNKLQSIFCIVNILYQEQVFGGRKIFFSKQALSHPELSFFLECQCSLSLNTAKQKKKRYTLSKILAHLPVGIELHLLTTISGQRNTNVSWRKTFDTKNISQSAW